MDPKIYIGIDPGVHGAIGLIHARSASVVDIPNRLKGGTGKIKYEIDAGRLASLIRQLTGGFDDVAVVMERLATMPGRPFRGDVEGQDKEGKQQSSAGAFSLGDSVGCIRGVIGALGHEIKWVTPIKWKNYWGITGQSDQKELARVKALDLYPALAFVLDRKKDHNRAEALLIARYGVEGQIERRT